MYLIVSSSNKDSDQPAYRRCLISHRFLAFKRFGTWLATESAANAYQCANAQDKLGLRWVHMPKGMRSSYGPYVALTRCSNTPMGKMSHIRLQL